MKSGSSRHRKRVAAKIAATASTFRHPSKVEVGAPIIIPALNAAAALDLALEALARRLSPWFQQGGHL